MDVRTAFPVPKRSHARARAFSFHRASFLPAIPLGGGLDVELRSDRGTQRFGESAVRHKIEQRVAGDTSEPRTAGQQRAERRGRKQERAPTRILFAFWAMTSGHARTSDLTRTLHIESAVLLALSLSCLCWNNEELVCCSTLLNVWSERWTATATSQQLAGYRQPSSSRRVLSSTALRVLS